MKYKLLTINKKIGEQIITIHPVIIFNEKELILCDTGYPNQMNQIDQELKKYGFSLEDISKIIITHHDHDHIGSLKEIKNKIENVEIISSQIEAPYINGQKESLRLLQAKEYNKNLKGKELEAGNQFINYLNTIQLCEIDKVVQNGEYILPDLKVISTPGHTPGHISILLENKRVLITGDALAFENDKLGIANPEFTLDLDLSKKSVQNLKKLNLNKIICYHGGLVDNGIDDLLKNIN